MSALVIRPSKFLVAILLALLGIVGAGGPLPLECPHAWAAEPSAEIPVWPGDPPGRKLATEEEHDTSGPDANRVAGKPVIRLGHVSRPMLQVFTPADEINTGAAVMVMPGGGYHILAYDLEGTEVCEWLNSIGVTGILLKYRVPRPQDDPRPIEPLQDAQRGLSLIRHQANRWNIDPERIGVLGFSAGGNLAARLSTNHHRRVYDTIDEVDQVSSRPNFTVLIYPAYLFDKESEALVASDLPVDEETPPTFLTMAFDDRVGPENILRFGLALKEAGVPAAVHLYPTGGHGYGLRPTDDPVTTWPARCEEWMRASSWLDPDSTAAQ